MIERVYRGAYWIFLAESSLILIGILTGVVSYGEDLATALTGFGIALGLILISGMRFFLVSLNTDLKKIIGLIISTFMIFLCFYYVMEDQFRIEI